MDVDTLIVSLGLRPHPEGGHFVETWRTEDAGSERPSGSAIYYLLRAGERSAWHRIDATEIWHFYAGDPLALSIVSPSGHGPAERLVLGPDIAAGQRPQLIVPADAWQSALSLGAWTLVGCTVSPAFLFDGFELAAVGWEPGG